MLEIIIPCFNSRDTLDVPLASIACQTARKRILVTIVDDCSTEPYDDVIDRYKGLINIRKLSTEENGGAGIARNVGIDNALGDFILFLDSDDGLASPIAVQTILHEAYRKFPDIFLTRFIQDSYGIITPMPLQNQTWIHGKVYSREFLQKNNIKFPPLRYNEDTAFNTISMNLTEKILELDFTTVVWVNNKNSTVRAPKDYYSMGIIQFLQGREFAFMDLAKRGFLDKARKTFIQNLMVIFYQYLDFYNYSPETVDGFNKELGRILRVVSFKEIMELEEYKEILFTSFINFRPSPRYGKLFPHVGLLEYFYGVYDDEEKN